MKISKFYLINKLKNVPKRRILFFEFWNATPHFQTALELAIRHARLNEKVTFLYAGRDVIFIERDINFKQSNSDPLRLLPEEAAIRLVNEKNIKFHIRVHLPKVKIEIPKFNSIDELLSFKYEDFSIGRAAASSLMFELGNSNPDVFKYSFLIEKIINSGLEVYQYSKTYFLKNKVDLVYVFNGRFCNQAALAAAARSCEIKILYHERGANQNLFFLEEFAPHDALSIQKKMIAQWYDAFDKNRLSAEETATDFFLSSRSGKEIGWKSYIKNQKINTLPSLAITKKIVTYFSSSDDEYAALRDFYVWKYWDNQYSAVLDLIKACNEIGNIDLHIRLHPNLQNKDPEDVQKWLDLEILYGVDVISPESEIDTYRLIEKSDIVVAAGSTVGIESVFWGTPCISMGPSCYSELDAVYHPENYTDLINLLSRSNLIADRNRALPYGFYFNTFGFKFEVFKPINLDSGIFYGQDITKTYRKLSLIDKIFTFFKN